MQSPKVASTQKDEGILDAAKENKKKIIRGCIITFAGACLWGSNATLVKYMLTHYNVDPMWLVCVRELGACWLFLLTAYLTNKQGLISAAHKPKDLGKIFLVGICGILGSNICYVKSIECMGSAPTTILQSISVLMVLAFVCIKYHRSPRAKEIAGVILAFVGTFLLATDGQIGNLNFPAEGLLWGMGTALTAAAFVILPPKLLETYGSFVVNGFAMLGVGAAFTILVQPWNMMPALDGAGWAMVVATVIMGTYGAYALYLYGLKEVGSMRASLLGNGESVMAIITSAIFLQTSFSGAELLGFAMIIVMVFLTA